MTSNIIQDHVSIVPMRKDIEFKTEDGVMNVFYMHEAFEFAFVVAEMLGKS